tara:strand:+ start:8581 stop:9567 length:987 start_codon:yes stop_codon:yes gene_type:complete
MKNELNKIFITGVAGMIGSNLARKILKSGHAVVGIDNLWRGTLDNISDLMEHENFSFRKADIISDTDWFSDMKHEDTIIHVADIVAGIGYVFANEWDVFSSNLKINNMIAQIVTNFEPERLIYLGTACSYPQNMQRSVNESVLQESDKFPADPESGYGWSKLIGEIEFKLAVKDASTKLIVLDLHNVYGWPCVYNDETSQVIPSLINRALLSKNGKLEVWGDGSQGRGFLHVNDVISAVEKSIDYSGDVSNFMIGPDFCTSISELANIIVANDLLPVNEVIYDTSKPMGDIGRFANSSLAQKELGWSVSTDFSEEINALIEKIVEDAK